MHEATRFSFGIFSFGGQKKSTLSLKGCAEKLELLYSNETE